MEENNKKPELYPLPFIVHSSYDSGMNVLFIFLIIMFIGPSFIPLNDIEGIFARILCLAFGLFFAFIWIYMGVLKKAYVELTEDEISFKTIFSFKKIKWADIADVQTYYRSHNWLIGISSKEKLKKRKNNLLTSISDLYGGQFYLSIPVRSFPEAEPEKLYSTIFDTAQKKYLHNCGEDVGVKYDSEDNKEYKQVESRPITALFMALLVSLISGIIYGFSIHLLKDNFVLIPILGMFGIDYAFSKFCKQGSMNILIRIYLGILCALQCFVALLTWYYMRNPDLIKMIGIWTAISDYTEYIFEYSKVYSDYFFIGIMLFLIEVLYGYSSKITRSIRKIFMKKQNGFYIKRDKRYVTICLIDYADYNENEEKRILRLAPNTCLIDKEKKNVLAFYIPEEFIDNSNIDTKYFERTSLGEKVYYKLNLGGNAEPEFYGYESLIIFNKHKQAESIIIEID